MKELTMREVELVSGGNGDCGAVPDAPDSGTLKGWYEAAIEFTSYVIERVANAL